MNPKSPVFAPVAWPAPANVKAIVTTRKGGASKSPYGEFNLALHVGDQPETVLANRAQLARSIGVNNWQWFDQAHSTRVVSAAGLGGVAPKADGGYTRATELALAILTADCLPVLLCDDAGTQVAALHAGWRGLAGGILAAGVATFDKSPAALMAYIGPAIGVNNYEVDHSLHSAFQQSPFFSSVDVCGAFTSLPQKPGHYLADLALLARLQLQQLGVPHIYGGNQCTYDLNQEFYSYRRDGQTGRFASVIWLENP